MMGPYGYPWQFHELVNSSFHERENNSWLMLTGPAGISQLWKVPRSLIGSGTPSQVFIPSLWRMLVYKEETLSVITRLPGGSGGNLMSLQ